MIKTDQGGKLPPKTDVLQETYEKLEQGISDMFNSDAYKLYLKTMSRFHRYSFNNTILITLQKPDASLIAGYTAWQKKFGRYVKRGEKGIKIFAPAPVKVKVEEYQRNENGELIKDASGKAVTLEIEKTIPKYKVVSVFDVSQTDGRELPTVGVESLQGEVQQYDKLFEAIKEVSPVPIRFEKMKGSVKGYYNREENIIAIAEGLEQLQTVKTAVHEMAHSMLHNKEKLKEQQIDTHTKEVQAESVAYAVCDYFGLDTSEYSFAYIGGWSKGFELEELKSSLETIKDTAARIIEDIEDQLGITKEKLLDQEITSDGSNQEEVKQKSSIREQLKQDNKHFVRKEKQAGRAGQQKKSKRKDGIEI